MKSLPIVTVVVPVYNQEKYIGRCIRSILRNKFKDEFEIIVVNDGCTDNTMEILNIFKNDIHILVNDQRQGLPAALNKGIRNARGQFIVRVDSDDYVNSEYLSLLAAHLLYNDSIDAVCCDYQLVDEDEQILSICKWMDEPIGCGLMFRIEHLIDIGLYDEHMLIHEDKDILIRFLEKYELYNVPLPLYRYRQHETNMTNDKKGMSDYMKKLINKHGYQKVNEMID